MGVDNVNILMDSNFQRNFKFQGGQVHRRPEVGNHYIDVGLQQFQQDRIHEAYTTKAVLGFKKA